MRYWAASAIILMAVVSTLVFQRQQALKIEAPAAVEADWDEDRMFEVGPRDIPSLTMDIGNHPNDYRTWLLRARAYIYGRDYERAVADYSKSLSLKPSGEVYLMRADAYRSLAQYDNALTDCNLALQVNGRYPTAYSKRASLLAYLGKDGEALADFSKALEIAPNRTDILMERANLYGTLAHSQQQKSDLLAATQSDSYERSDALEKLTNILISEGKTQEAITVLQKFQPIARRAKYDLQDRSKLWLKLGRKNEAKQDLLSALEIQEREIRENDEIDGFDHTFLANLLEDLGRPQESLRARKKALEVCLALAKKNPKDYEAWADVEDAALGLDDDAMAQLARTKMDALKKQ